MEFLKFSGLIPVLVWVSAIWSFIVDYVTIKNVDITGFDGGIVTIIKK